jgi:diguanylate cyclase (GGDEF)-like protein
MGGEARRVPDEVVTAVEALRTWTASLPGDGDPREPQAPRREVVDAVVEALHRRLVGGGAIGASEVVTSLVANDIDVLRAMDDVRMARDAVHEQLVLTLAPALAFQAVEELNEVSDQVLREATDHALRNLRVDAFTDALTGAANRRAFERDLHRLLETAKRHNRQLAVAIIDLDGLKRLNDERGHAAGDQALRELVDAFQGHLRAGDGLYRIGGDEFALLLPESGAPAVDALLDRARMTAPAFSQGWAAHPDDGDTATGLVQRADERLFEGRHLRRATSAAMSAAAQPARASNGLQFLAATFPVLLALGLAELVRRMVGVDLGSVLVQSWVGLLVVGGVLGPPVARRWCTGHPGLTATATCSARVGSVVLLILVAALVPVSRLREAIDMAALQRGLQAERPSEPSRGGASTGPTASGPRAPSETGGVAAGALPFSEPSVSATTPRSTRKVQPIANVPVPTTPLALVPSVTPAVPEPTPTPATPAPTSGIETKVPNGSLATRPLESPSETKISSPAGGPPHRPGKNPPMSKIARRAINAGNGGGGVSNTSNRRGK